MSTFDFEEIAAIKERELSKLKERRSLLDSIEKRRSEGLTPIISEIKKASPSRGEIRDIEPIDAAISMESGGACAISVLTDRNFRGELHYLRDVKNNVSIPVLRKDFIVDRFQLHESLANGADAVLIIATLLKDKTRELVSEAGRLGMEALVEVHDTEDIPYALESGSPLIGINNRNLKTLETDLGNTERLIGEIPSGKTIVCESGIKGIHDIARMEELGVSAFLIGTGIMLSPDIEAKVRELVYNKDD